MATLKSFNLFLKSSLVIADYKVCLPIRTSPIAVATFMQRATQFSRRSFTTDASSMVQYIIKLLFLQTWTISMTVLLCFESLQIVKFSFTLLFILRI